MAQEITVVVTGSTGKQGGAVARGLLERGHKVPAVTRDPNSSQAKLLANAAAALVTVARSHGGDYEGARRSDLSLRDDDAPSGGTDAETRCRRRRGQGSRRAYGLHFRRLRQPTDRIPHFDSKYEVEKHIAKAGVRATGSSDGSRQ